MLFIVLYVFIQRQVVTSYDWFLCHSFCSSPHDIGKETNPAIVIWTKLLELYIFKLPYFTDYNDELKAMEIWVVDGLKDNDSNKEEMETQIRAVVMKKRLKQIVNT